MLQTIKKNSGLIQFVIVLAIVVGVTYYIAKVKCAYRQFSIKVADVPEDLDLLRLIKKSMTLKDEIVFRGLDLSLDNQRLKIIAKTPEAVKELSAFLKKEGIKFTTSCISESEMLA